MESAPEETSARQADTQLPQGEPSAAPSSALEPPRPARAGRRIGRRAQLIGVLLVLVVVGALAFVGQGLLSGTPTSTTSKTVWQNITSGIRDTGVPKDVALQAFAYLYKVTIPGVTVPSGTDGGDAPTSGSGAMRWVQAVWDQLTPDQQAVINRYQVPDPNDIAVPANPASPITSSASGATKPEFQLTAARKATPAKVGAAPEAPANIVAALEAELTADLAHIGPRLNMPVLTMGGILNTDVRLHVSDLDGGNTLFTTQPKVMLNGHYVPCDITAWSNVWQGQVSSSGQVSDALHVEMTHEVIHCYQNVVWGDLATGYAIPAWITEGTALYLAAVDTGIEEHMIAGKWKNDYFTPETPLTNRAYDAFGYYALLDYLGRDMWGLIKQGWTAAAASAQRSNSFIAVLRGDDQDVRDSWPTSYLRQDLWGAPWIMHGFGLPDSAQVYRRPAQALADPGYLGTLESRSNTILGVTASVGEVVTVTTTGLANVHDESGNNQLSFQTQKFCTSGECICPANTPKAGQKIATKTLTLPFVLALNAPFGGSTYSVIGRKLEDECGLKATPQPQKVGPCVSKCAGSNGDPHLLTVNNYRYDFQGAGEFTLLRSKDASLEIQTRQEPYVSTGMPRVATNTAIAAKVGSHRVGVYAGADALAATLDGKTLDATQTTDLGGGARIVPYPKGLEIDFPDGTKLWTLWVGIYGINAEIAPSDALRASGVGLLGAIVPGGLGVPALPDGTRLPIAADKHARNAAVYGPFADAWRVTDATTLFDYDSGRTTATYTQKGFPADTADVTYADLTAEQRAAGGSACAAITDQQLNDACVFDVGVSGQSGFSDSYVAIQGLYDSGIAAPGGSPAPQAQSSDTPLPGKVAGAVAVMKATGVSGAVVGPDGKLYFSVSLAGGKFSLVEVDPTTATIVQQVDIPKATSLSVAAGSVWAPGLIVDSNGNNCGVTRFDAQTLAIQATIPIACAAFGPTIASDRDAVWYEDISKWDAGTGKGAVLVRLDPTTNQPGTTVPLPFINGSYSDSQGALFVSKADSGVYRLTTGGSTLEPLGQLKNRVFAAGAGFWVQGDTDKTALYYTHADSPDATVTINGSLVGGDTSAAYAEVSGQDGIAQLWRYPPDGSAPTQIGTAPTVDTKALSYFADPQPLPAPHGVAKYWVIASSDATWTLYLQWLPLP